MTQSTLWIDAIEYLGRDFNPRLANWGDEKVSDNFLTFDSPKKFYAETDIYIYHGIGYFLSGVKRPYYARLLEMAGQADVHILDYGCGGGDDGLLFARMGFSVSFADISSRSLEFCQWRIEGLGIVAKLYVIGHSEIPRHDLVWCMDVLEHLPPEQHRTFLEHLASLGKVVFVNLVNDPKADGKLHHPVDQVDLSSFVGSRWNAYAQNFYDGRTVLLIYGDDVGRVPKPQGAGE